MNVLFIYPSDNRTYNAGIGYLSAVLKQNGHNTDLFMTGEFDTEGLQQHIETFQPDLVAVSSVTNQFPLASKYIQYVKKLTGLPVILGGVHATIQPGETIRTEGLDGICLGEGEEALLEYVKRLDTGESLHDIQNFWIKDNDTLYKNPLRPLLVDLERLPLPDYSLFDYGSIIEDMGVFMVFANRGCPYECSYCINHTLVDLYKSDHFVRYMPVPRLMEVLSSSLKCYPQAKIIEFFDDTFILNKKWLREFAELYPRQIGLPFYCNGRANLITEEIVDLLKLAGCIRVNLAIETGNEKMRKEVLKKNVSNSELENAFSLLKDAGIRIYTHNMVGIPYETEDTIKETIELNRKLKVDDLQCWVFYPYPGSSSFTLCKRMGWLSDRIFDTVAGDSVTSTLDQPTISHERIRYYHRIFKFLVLGENTPQQEIPLDYMNMGHEEGQMISGWNNLEFDDDIYFRWTTEKASFYLRNTQKPFLALLVNFPAPIPPILVEVIINGLSITQFIPTKGEWRWYMIAIPKLSEPLLEISLKMDNVYLPSYHYPNDNRKLGLAVSKATLRSKWEYLNAKFIHGMK